MADVCAGVDEDLQTLLDAFVKKGSMRLVRFHEVAAEYKLHRIYAGRINAAECVEFAEGLLRWAFAYTAPGAAATPRSSLTRVFGIYATYVFFYAQPTDYTAKIHYTSVDLTALLDFVKTTLIPGRHLDAVGCVYKLVADDAFSLVPFHNDFDPVTQKRISGRAEPPAVDLEEDKLYEPLELTCSLMNGPVFKTMRRVQSDIEMLEVYTGMSGRTPKHNNNSFVARVDNFFAELQEEISKVDTYALQEAKQEVVVKTEPTDDNNNNNLRQSPYLLRSSIRNRAYQSAVDVQRSRRTASSIPQCDLTLVKTECNEPEEEKCSTVVKVEPNEEESENGGGAEPVKEEVGKFEAYSEDFSTALAELDAEYTYCSPKAITTAPLKTELDFEDEVTSAALELSPDLKFNDLARL